MAHSDFARDHPESAARVIVTSYVMGGDVQNAWEVLAAGVGPESAVEHLRTAAGDTFDAIVSDLPASREVRLALARVYARRAGAEAGKAAATWVFDGNTSLETMRRVRQGLDDGDPEILDTLPWCDLSGQYADSPTPRTVASDAMSEADLDLDMNSDLGAEVEQSLADAYEEAFNDAMRAEVERVLTVQLSDITTDSSE